MRLAVISDMHGNDLALAAVLEDLDRRGYDQIVCLGDAVQGGPQPAEVVQRLRERNIPVVMGNADSWLITGFESGAEDIPEARMKMMEEVRQWSLSRLSQKDQVFIAAFKPTLSIDLGNRDSLLCFHGSPASFDDLLLPDDPHATFEKLLSKYAAKYFCGGHTHVQFLRHLADGFHFNPGSAGSAYRHHQPENAFVYDHFAEYAILSIEPTRASLEFSRVPFDTEELASIYRSSGRPYYEKAVAELTTPVR